MANPKGYCTHCQNTGWIDCHCGGDLCVCENNGEEPCFYCDGGDAADDDFDDFEEGYDAGEWNNAGPEAETEASHHDGQLPNDTPSTSPNEA